MNRALIQQVLDALEKLAEQSDCDIDPFTFGRYGGNLAIQALRAELAKPEPEPVGHQFQSRDGNWCEIVNQQHYEATLADGSWPIRPVYAAPTEPNCKFPTCHSQEYQDKLVQEILGQEPIGWATVAQLKRGASMEGATPPSFMNGLIPLYTKGTPNA